MGKTNSDLKLAICIAVIVISSVIIMKTIVFEEPKTCADYYLLGNTFGDSCLTLPNERHSK